MADDTVPRRLGQNKNAHIQIGANKQSALLFCLRKPCRPSGSGTTSPTTNSSALGPQMSHYCKTSRKMSDVQATGPQRCLPFN